MARTSNTTEIVIAKPTIQQIAAMSKAERAAYIAAKTGQQAAAETELDISALSKHYANVAIGAAGRAAGTVKEIASGAKSAFMAGYLSALDD